MKKELLLILVVLTTSLFITCYGSQSTTSTERSLRKRQKIPINDEKSIKSTTQKSKKSTTIGGGGSKKSKKSTTTGDSNKAAKKTTTTDDSNKSKKTTTTGGDSKKSKKSTGDSKVTTSKSSISKFLDEYDAAIEADRRWRIRDRLRSKARSQKRNKDLVLAVIRCIQYITEDNWYDKENDFTRIVALGVNMNRAGFGGTHQSDIEDLYVNKKTASVSEAINFCCKDYESKWFEREQIKRKMISALKPKEQGAKQRLQEFLNAVANDNVGDKDHLISISDLVKSINRDAQNYIETAFWTRIAQGCKVSLQNIEVGKDRKKYLIKGKDPCDWFDVIGSRAFLDTIGGPKKQVGRAIQRHAIRVLLDTIYLIAEKADILKPKDHDTSTCSSCNRCGSCGQIPFFKHLLATSSNIPVRGLRDSTKSLLNENKNVANCQTRENPSKCEELKIVLKVITLIMKYTTSKDDDMKGIMLKGGSAQAYSLTGPQYSVENWALKTIVDIEKKYWGHNVVDASQSIQSLNLQTSQDKIKTKLSSTDMCLRMDIMLQQNSGYLQVLKDEKEASTKRWETGLTIAFGILTTVGSAAAAAFGGPAAGTAVGSISKLFTDQITKQALHNNKKFSYIRSVEMSFVKGVRAGLREVPNDNDKIGNVDYYHLNRAFASIDEWTPSVTDRMLHGHQCLFAIERLVKSAIAFLRPSNDLSDDEKTLLSVAGIKFEGFDAKPESRKALLLDFTSKLSNQQTFGRLMGGADYAATSPIQDLINPPDPSPSIADFWEANFPDTYESPTTN